MKLHPSLACLSMFLSTACTRGVGSEGGTRLDVHCELLALEPTTDDQATASFRATNQGDAVFRYPGYTPDGPLYRCEVLESGAWQPSPLGWCGTGLAEQVLEPGQSVEFNTLVPRDGRSYRFELGEPPVRTPEVSSAPAEGPGLDLEGSLER